MHKLADLEVFIDLDERQRSSVSERIDGKYRITLRPNNLELPWNTAEEGRVVLAHELGHFLAMVTLTEEHVSGSIADWLGLPISPLPQENEAWHYAGLIKPGADKSPIKEQALATYNMTDPVAKLLRVMAKESR